jgi:hypothetical protein
MPVGVIQYIVGCNCAISLSLSSFFNSEKVIDSQSVQYMRDQVHNAYAGQTIQSTKTIYMCSLQCSTLSKISNPNP